MISVGIIGLGLMGGSLARALHENCPDVIIYGSDNKEEHFAYCLENKIIDYGLEINSYAKLDILFLAVPVCSIMDVLNRIIPHLNLEKILVTDMGSTKSEINRKITENYPELNYIGGHPMTGRELSGPQAALANLFRDKNYILLKENELLIDLLQNIGSNIIILDSERHDRLVAFTSHLPQILATTISNQYSQVKEEDKHLPLLTGSGYLDLSRIAASDDSMWQDIFLTNQNNILERIKEFKEQLNILQQAIENKDRKLIKNLMINGKKERLQLKKEKKDGFNN